jgi:hypothetical protein
MMTHAQLKRLDLQTAIDLVRAAPIGFVLEVMWDEAYAVQLRGAAAVVAAPFFHGKMTARRLPTASQKRGAAQRV